jgi:hypothetical protein
VRAAAFKKVGAVIGAAHAALQGVNEQLIKGIEKMKEGEEPDFTFDPSPIPDWSRKPATPASLPGRGKPSRPCWSG